MKLKHTKSTSGFSLTELVVVMAILVIVMIAVTSFERDIFLSQANISSSYNESFNAQVILKTMLTELREMAAGADGSYALVNAGSTTISFFADPDHDGVQEQVTYTLINGTLYRALINPTGQPPSYSVQNQSTTTLVSGLTNGTSFPVFQYFDQNYSGTSSPLAQPVTSTAVRLVKVNLVLTQNLNHLSVPVTYSVQASLRNLKTNL